MLLIAVLYLCYAYALAAGTGCVQVTVNTNEAVKSSTCSHQADNDLTVDKHQTIAFHAIMNATSSPSAGQTMIFNSVKTNVGNGYSGHTGVFTVPRSGVYVFVYVIRIATAEHSTELRINDEVHGATFLRAKNGDDGSVSGTVVAHANKGDKVYIRNHSKYAGDGYYNSNIHGQPTFSGWMLN